MNTKTFAKCFAILAVLGLIAACNGHNTPGPSTTAITAQPTDQSVVVGTTATFNVVASNATGYQWQRSTNNGTTFTDVSGATVASHTTAATTLSDSGTQYRVLVSGASNSVTSSAVTLTVTPVVVAPSISVQPANQSIIAGQNASFTVTAGGSSLVYQWQEAITIIDGGVNFVNMVGETNATLTLTALSLSDNARQFRVVVSNSAGSVISNAALLTVNSAQTVPAFSTQPANQSVVAPDSATFGVAATGTPSPTLQWQLSANAGGSFADIAGATASSYTTAATAAGDNGNQYRVIATNSAGTTTSNVATLSVTLPAAPSFTTHPANVTITAGQNAQFTVAVSGAPTPTLQWQLSTDSGANWSNITGETGTVFNVTGAALANNGRQFRAVASNRVSTLNSNAAVLTVTAVSPVTITTPPSLPTGTVNLPYTVTLAASGGTPPYTWSAGSTFPSFLSLNASTGEISGTPTAVASYVFAIEVRDSANPPQSNQQYFYLTIDAVCDTGLGSVTVDGAPNTVGGKFCPQTRTIQGQPNADGNVYVSWAETSPGVYEGVTVMFHLVTGELVSVSYTLNDQTRLWTYLCVPTATVSYPACSGVTLNTSTGRVSFSNTVVGSGTSPVFTLNGALTY